MGDRTTITRDLWDAFSDGDIERVLSFLAPDVECFPSAHPNRSKYDGHDGVRQMATDFHDVMGRFRIELDSMQQVQDRVFCRGRVCRENSLGTFQELPFRMSIVFRDLVVVAIESHT